MSKGGRYLAVRNGIVVTGLVRQCLAEAREIVEESLLFKHLTAEEQQEAENLVAFRLLNSKGIAM